MSNCGCNNSGGSPPDSTPNWNTQPTGSGTSYGGPTKILRGTCGPAKCPTPPTVSGESPDPYKPGWLAKLTTSPFGKLIVSIGDYLYLLRSKCSGYLFYNADTEQVSVEDPPFVSAAPRESNFGFLAKAVPAQHTICTDASDDCPTEGRQELAAQIMGEANCGQLVIARPPDCGELPINESADADKQVRFDYLNPIELTSKQCPGEARFLLKRPGKRGKTDCDEWIFMRRLRFAKTQWGGLADDAPIPDGSFIAMLVPVEGGEDSDPCFELRLSNIPLTKQSNTQQIFMLANYQTLVRGISTGLSRYSEMVAKGSKLWAILWHRTAVTGNSSTGGSFLVSANGVECGIMELSNGGADATENNFSVIPLTEDKITISITGSFVGSPTYSSEFYRLRGYIVEP